MSAENPQQSSAHPTTAEIPFIYPQHWEADVVLRDGATAHLRPVIPTDREALQQMYAGQSERTIYLRFFAPKPALSEKELNRFTTVDHVNRVAFVLFLGEEMIGIGRYDRTNDPTEAEVAFMISDHHQGRGIGSILLEHLAAAAKERGINRFAAEVLPQNRAMLNVFGDAGYEVSREFDDGFVAVHFEIDPTDRSRQVMESREHRAEAQSIAELLSPESVAVIADSTSSSVAQSVLKNIVERGYTGAVYAVGDESVAIDGVNTIATLGEAPKIDLAIITVPVEQVSTAVEQCGQAGIRGALILTGGFADDGARGRARQKALVKTARSYGMRIIGPESFGLINNAAEIQLDTTFTNHDPHPGGLGVFTQSSVLGTMFSNFTVHRNIGVSSLVSAGNRADVSGNDLMQYWEDDPQTEVCALYLESIGNPRKFSRIARRLSRTKPVIVAKNALTGLQLPAGHSGRTAITPAPALESLFRQAGVISAESSEQVLDVAQLLVAMPLPDGRRVGIVSNARALAQMVEERCALHQIKVKFSEPDLNITPDEREILHEVARAALEASDIDALIGVFLCENSAQAHHISEILLNVSQQQNKPVVGVFPAMAQQTDVMQGLHGASAPAESESEPEAEPESEAQAESEVKTGTRGLPCFSLPLTAVDALAAVMNYVQWRGNDHGEFVAPTGVKPQEVANFISDLLPEVSGENLLKLSQEQLTHILSLYGINLLSSHVVDTADEALAAAEKVGGYPVVLKSTDDLLSKRLDLGGVRLGIENQEQLSTEFEAMRRNLARYGIHEIEIQHQAEPGQSAVIEAVEDPLLGPVVSFGMSGDATAILNDWAYRVPPLTASDIAQLIRAPRAATKLFDHNELASGRVDLLEDLAARVALLKDNHPEIASLQLSPIIVGENELTVARAKMFLGNPQQRTDSARRTMSAG